MSDYIKCDRLVNNKTKECRYYASDLNKYISKHCEWSMSVGNIDAWQYKRIGKRHYIRLIESKHKNERTGAQQKTVFDFLDLLFRVARLAGIYFEFYIIEGTYPYDSVVVKEMSGKEYRFNNKEFLDFLNFKNK